MGRPSTKRYIGLKFKSQKSTLEVVGITEGLRRNKLILECSVCSKDKELFYYGSILGDYSDLICGKLPCGCSNSTRTEKQNMILAERAAKEKGLVFLGWSCKGYLKKKTFVRLYNPKLEYCWDTTILQYLLSTENICCPETRRLGNRRSSDKSFLQKAISVYPEGTIFERDDSGKVDHSGRDMYWKVYCPVCTVDEYSLAGISNGEFTVTTNSLRTGQLSCRCAGDRYQRNPEEYVYWIQKRGEETGYYLDTNQYTKFSSRKMVTYLCPEGHECTSRLGIYLYNPTCGKCSIGGFDPSKPANLYIVRWYGYGNSYLKFGITNKEVLRRVSQQSSKSQHLDYVILQTFYSVSGQSVWDCEKVIKKNIKGSICPKQWFPDGYTETVEDTPENLEKMLGIISTFNLKETTNDLNTKGTTSPHKSN